MPRRPGSAQLARRLGARIRALRKEAGLTQESLAWSCDLAKPYLSQVEAGKRLPSVPVLAQLARRVGVELADLFVLEPKNDRLRLLEALRRRDVPAIEASLRALGVHRSHARPQLLMVAETTSTRTKRRMRD